MFWKIFSELCREKHVTPNGIRNEIGVSSGAITSWKNGRVPHYSTLLSIAKYFDVSVDYLLGKTDIKKDPPGVMPIGNLIPLKLIASVRAGYGGTAIADWDGDYEMIPEFILRGYPPEECVMMKVQGNSMYPRLLNGDRIVVHVQSSVDSGDVAVVIYNGDEGTVKKVNYVSGEDWMELIPNNPEYQTKRIEGADLEQCRVYGKVIGMIGNV